MELKNQTKGNTAELVKETHSGKGTVGRMLHSLGGKFIQGWGDCVVYGGIIKKVVLKDLKCEAGEWKPDAIDTGNDQCFVHLLCGYRVSPLCCG